MSLHFFKKEYLLCLILVSSCAWADFKSTVLKQQETGRVSLSWVPSDFKKLKPSFYTVDIPGEADSFYLMICASLRRVGNDINYVFRQSIVFRTPNGFVEYLIKHDKGKVRLYRRNIIGLEMISKREMRKYAKEFPAYKVLSRCSLVDCNKIRESDRIFGFIERKSEKTNFANKSMGVIVEAGRIENGCY